MSYPYLLHHLIDHAAARTPEAVALRRRGETLTYAELGALQDRFAAGVASAGLERSARVAIYLGKSFEMVAAAFGSTKADCCFVPINPVLKTPQVAHILNDCAVQILVTSPERLHALNDVLTQCPTVRLVVLTGPASVAADERTAYRRCNWAEFTNAPFAQHRAPADADMAAILYTSGSTGRPKGVVVSHRNMVSGAMSVASYLENRADDRLLAVLPLSFDAGFSQLTTAFHVGASVVLIDYLLPQEVIQTIARERVTGVTAVPPLWIQLSEVAWPESIREHLRYFANTGGKMPREILARLRTHVPAAKPFLMYGLTEAFRSTYLPPNEVDRRPDSIGKAIPNQEVMVVRPDGTPCAPNEPGELVHRGSTVSLGYWGDAEQTAVRFRPVPRTQGGLMLPETAVFSGDTVRMDEEGYLYFVGRTDEMIKSSGYRISPVEVEEAVYASGLVAEVAALGLPDERLGQAVALVLLPLAGVDFTVHALERSLERSLPRYMWPQRLEVRSVTLPRNCNGKIDRKRLAQELFEPTRMTQAVAV
jgi:acyl-CoA ligase (AMP-forming) (exosortase A-associated)